MIELSPPQFKDADAIIAAFLPRHAWGEGAVERFVARMRRNKYPLLALEEVAAENTLLARSPAWHAALAEDARALEEQRSEFMAVKRAWAEAGIPSVLFKSGGTEPSFPYTSDNVDVLVPHGRTLDARRILLDLGYVWLRNIDEEQKWLFRRFVGGRSVSAVHVHGWVGWDVEFHERAIWDGVRQSPDDAEEMVPSREDALLINAAHALYENKEIRLYDLEKIRAQWSHDLDWDYIEGIARRRGWLDGLYFALLVCQKLERELYGYRTVGREVIARWKKGLRAYGLQSAYWHKVSKRPFQMPFRVSFGFSKLLYYKKIARDSHDGVRARARNVVRTLAWGAKQKSGVRPQPGRLIALSGLDGSGKTAHAQALSQAMETSEVINRVVWTRLGCSPLYRVTLGRLGVASGPDGAASVRGRRAAPLRGIVGQFWAWANAIDMALVYTWKVRVPLTTGKVVICDRYVADAAVEMAHRLGRPDPMSIAAVRALRALAPKPSATYLLDAPADVSAERSLDPEDAGDLAAQRGLYGRAARSLRVRRLDVSGDFATANDALVLDALQRYEDGFATLTNGLFLSNPGQLNPSEGLVRFGRRRSSQDVHRTIRGEGDAASEEAA